MITVGGNMTGSGAWMSPLTPEKKRAIQGGWKPYTIVLVAVLREST